MVIGINEAVWVTHLSETAVQVAFEGELVEWEDVRLQMLDDQGAPIPGKIYGKVTQVQPGAEADSPPPSASLRWRRRSTRLFAEAECRGLSGVSPRGA